MFSKTFVAKWYHNSIEWDNEYNTFIIYLKLKHVYVNSICYYRMANSFWRKLWLMRYTSFKNSWQSMQHAINISSTMILMRIFSRESYELFRALNLKGQGHRERGVRIGFSRASSVLCSPLRKLTHLHPWRPSSLLWVE